MVTSSRKWAVPAYKTMEEQCLYTESVLGQVGAYKGPVGMSFLTRPITQGTYVEVEPPRKRFHSCNEQRVLQNTWQTQRVDRVAQCGTNQVLDDKQIQDFIASTVLPRHRTLINSAGGINWSNNQPKKIPTHQRFNMDQGSQEEGITIPQGTLHQDKCDQQRTLDETTCIPQGIDYPHRIQSEGICNVQGLHSSISNGTQGNFPRGIEEEVISVQQEIISIPGQSPLCKTSYVPQEIINFPQGKQGQDQNMYDLSKGIDCQGPQKWGMPIQGVTTNDVSDHIQPGSTNIQPGLISHIATTQPEVHIEQNLKESSDNVQQLQLTNVNVESSSLSLIAERSRAIAAEVFSDAAQHVVQVNVDKKSGLEVTPDHEHETQTSTTSQQSRKRKRTESADIENKIKQSPLKHQKVNREAADMTWQIESKPGKKVWSKNIADHEEFMEDAIKILQGQSADIFPESVIDQLFKDTFESDISLTSSDEFVVDPLVFFNSEFGLEFCKVSKMHPDLSAHLHTDECNTLIKVFTSCQEQHGFLRFLGYCDPLFTDVQKCLRRERSKRTNCIIRELRAILGVESSADNLIQRA
uniref:Uncharacterized protein C16orf61-like protein n=1 Tax=Magallana gigas TaxID=29159 RepID=K1QPA5_MAGGI